MYFDIIKHLRETVETYTMMDVEDVLDELYDHYKKESEARKICLKQDPKYVLEKFKP